MRNNSVFSLDARFAVEIEITRLIDDHASDHGLAFQSSDCINVCVTETSMPGLNISLGGSLLGDVERQ